MDGTAPGPAPTVTPDVVSTDGRLRPGDDQVQYMVADHGITPVGRVVSAKDRWPLRWKLYRVTSPLRLRQSLEGVYGDDWGRPRTALNQFSRATDRPGVIKV